VSEVDLDSMTKDELLEHAKSLGVSPANNAMTKDELRQAIDEHESGAPPEAGLQVTTTRTKDYLGVPLVNTTPGTSAATDRLGRSVVAADKDFLGRALVP
jgi:hypothetical protein